MPTQSFFVRNRGFSRQLGDDEGQRLTLYCPACRQPNRQNLGLIPRNVWMPGSGSRPVAVRLQRHVEGCFLLGDVTREGAVEARQGEPPCEVGDDHEDVSARGMFGGGGEYAEARQQAEIADPPDEKPEEEAAGGDLVGASRGGLCVQCARGAAVPEVREPG